MKTFKLYSVMALLYALLMPSIASAQMGHFTGNTFQQVRLDLWEHGPIVKERLSPFEYMEMMEQKIAINSVDTAELSLPEELSYPLERLVWPK